MKHASLLVLAACASNPPTFEPSPDAANELVDTRAPYNVWRQQEPIYELYVRHFSPSGDFAGVEAQLDELKDLGVGIIWLLPVNEIGSIDHIDAPHGNPYAVKAYERLNPEYGTDEEFRSLIRAAHHRGMSVIVDWVPNHTAWDNHLIAEHPEWYVHRDGQIASVGGDFEWIAQLDWSNRDLRRYMTDVMVDWVRRYDFDGFRIDFAHHMPVDYFVELRRELEAIKPMFLLAEAGDVARHDAFDMTYDWDVYPVLGDVAKGWRPVSAIDDELYFDQLLPYADRPNALIMRMTYNHDDNGRFTLDDHYGGGVKTAAVLAATLPGKPLVFQGQEVGDDKSLGHDPAIKTDWSDPDGFRPFYTKLLQLFRANSALHHAGMSDFRKVDLIPGDYPYAFIRRDGDNAVLVIANMSPTDYPSVVIAPQPNAGAIDGTYVELFTERTETIHAGQAIHLGPWEYRVYVRGPLRAEPRAHANNCSFIPGCSELREGGDGPFTASLMTYDAGGAQYQRLSVTYRELANSDFLGCAQNGSPPPVTFTFVVGGTSFERTATVSCPTTWGDNVGQSDSATFTIVAGEDPALWDALFPPGPGGERWFALQLAARNAHGTWDSRFGDNYRIVLELR